MTDEAWLTEFWRLAEAWRCTVKSRDYFAAKEALAAHIAVKPMYFLKDFDGLLVAVPMKTPEYESDEHD